MPHIAASKTKTASFFTTCLPCVRRRTHTTHAHSSIQLAPHSRTAWPMRTNSRDLAVTWRVGLCIAREAVDCSDEPPTGPSSDQCRGAPGVPSPGPRRPGLSLSLSGPVVDGVVGSGGGAAEDEQVCGAAQVAGGDGRHPVGLGEHQGRALACQQRRGCYGSGSSWPSWNGGGTRSSYMAGSGG